MFISSYIPLYILLVIKNILERITTRGRISLSKEQICNMMLFDEVNDYAIIFLLILCVSSWIYLKKMTKKAGNIHYYIVKNIEDQSGNVYFNYISIYLLSCLGLSLNNIVDVFVLIFLMFIVGYIYIENHMTYMNPTLQFFKYKVYECEIYSMSTKTSFKSIVMARMDVELIVNEKYAGSGKGDFVCITKKMS